METLVPPVIYVACEVADDQSFTPDLRRTTDGEVTLLAYTALDRLIACCGENQPWVVVATARLEDVQREVPFDAITFDVEIPEEHRRTAV
ncbi:SAV_915 family protein [Actinokineospora iranica]|uniref:SseB protein N-terminal domain-containing protein n=1 Tax=Actinokineospora iranica TaxID=1271860 RepID=A0A1G6SA44_9PSEU|nr:SAV_915 family protein [Actinokineospora iranica]SDD13748.1 hypothetical protein SAMN05216174_107312 [Actinokineospora iranica]